MFSDGVLGDVEELGFTEVTSKLARRAGCGV
jgi:hypothetical protein